MFTVKFLHSVVGVLLKMVDAQNESCKQAAKHLALIFLGGLMAVLSEVVQGVIASRHQTNLSYPYSHIPTVLNLWHHYSTIQNPATRYSRT